MRSLSTQQITELIVDETGVFVIKIPVPKLLLKLFKLAKESIYDQIFGDLVFESTI